MTHAAAGTLNLCHYWLLGEDAGRVLSLQRPSQMLLEPTFGRERENRAITGTMGKGVGGSLGVCWHFVKSEHAPAPNNNIYSD